MSNETDKIKDLERRIKELEDAVFKQLPFKEIPPSNPWRKIEPAKWPYDDNKFPDWPQKFPDMFPEPENKCPKCGVNWEGAMLYCCPDHKCPMGAGPIMC